MGKRALLCAVLSASVVFAGCPANGPDPDPDPMPVVDGGSNTDAGDGTDAGQTVDAGQTDAGQTDTEFTSFVRSEIVNRTSPSTSPVTIDDKTFTDSENPNAFEPAFFQ